jgi:hypothetical protein
VELAPGEQEVDSSAGDHVIGTGGVDGLLGCVGGGVAFVGVCVVPAPHPLRVVLTANRSTDNRISQDSRIPRWGPEKTTIPVIALHLGIANGKNQAAASRVERITTGSGSF